jgi:hypothetical protein
MTAMSPNRVAQLRADWRARATSRATSSYVRAFTKAFFGFGKDQVTAMRIAERGQTAHPVQAGRRRPWLVGDPESA